MVNQTLNATKKSYLQQKKHNFIVDLTIMLTEKKSSNNTDSKFNPLINNNFIRTPAYSLIFTCFLN